MTLDCTGAFHELRLSQDAAKKSALITHLGKFKWNIAPFGLALLLSYYSKAMQDTLSGLEDFARKLHGRGPNSIIHRKGTNGSYQASS